LCSRLAPYQVPIPLLMIETAPPTRMPQSQITIQALASRCPPMTRKCMAAPQQ
jgi:hypothetical protein